MAALSIQETVTLLREIVAELPEVRNPRSATCCVYETECPREGEHTRCIVGELLHRIGAPAPEHSGPIEHHEGYEEWLACSTQDWLGEVQLAFDTMVGYIGGHLRSRRWAAALAECERTVFP